MSNRVTLILCGLASSLVSVIAFFINPFFAIGIVYSCCVLAPWSRMLGRSLGATFVTVVLGSLAYPLAVSIALIGPFTPCLGGLVGSGLMLMATLEDDPAILRAMLRTVCVGTIVPVIMTFGAWYEVGFASAVVTVLVWQFATTIALATAFQKCETKPAERLEPPDERPDQRRMRWVRIDESKPVAETP